MFRSVLFLHRWLGVGVGFLRTIWCLSGFVMMYMDYPRLSVDEELRALGHLELPGAGPLNRISLSRDQALSSARVEMSAGRPLLRITPAEPDGQMRTPSRRFDLISGAALDTISVRELRRSADDYGRFANLRGPVSSFRATAVDQWTVQSYRAHQPLYRADFADPAGTRIYLSGASGEVVQQTTGAERFWNWFGAVPHWLYPTLLRQNGVLWNQVVIWISLAGCFLTLTGLWTGMKRLRRKRDGRISSPFRGHWWWHHVFGLWFGLLTLTWVASGLFSMNPWGFLDSVAGPTERRQLAGEASWGDLREALAVGPDLPAGTVRIDAVPLSGMMYLAATDREGHVIRFDRSGKRAPLERRELEGALKFLGKVESLDLLTTEDDYYYKHKDAAKLPVWRGILNDSQQTRLYIDAETGALVRAYDRDGRRFRWLMNGLHSLDLPGLRIRPLWDLIVLSLLALVTLVCATGTWMGVSRVRRDIRRWRLRRRRVPQCHERRILGEGA